MKDGEEKVRESVRKESEGDSGKVKVAISWKLARREWGVGGMKQVRKGGEAGRVARGDRWGEVAKKERKGRGRRSRRRVTQANAEVRWDEGSAWC